MVTRLASLLCASALLVPAAARADVGFSVEGFYGLARPSSADFSAAVSGAADDPDLVDSSLNMAGGNLLLRFGVFEVGAIADVSWKSGSASQTAFGALVGFGGDVGRSLRLDLLGEVGGHRYGNFTENPDIVTAGSSDEWFAYVGLRPGIAWRLPMGDSAVLVGLWGFARWDLTTSDVAVTVGSAGDAEPGSVELGGTTIGVVARVGFEF
jgi:hypothetical protein